MEYKPHDYQKYATEFIVTHPVAAVILQMGLGKTVCTLDAINQLMYDSFEIRKVLVIAPLRVAKVTWSDEIRKWRNLSHLRYSIAVGTEKERVAALNADADIYIINRENVQWLVEKSGVPFEYDMVVIDELSSFKKRIGILRREGRQLPNGRIFFENDLSPGIGINLQRVSLTDSHCSSNLFRYNNSA